MSKEIKFVVSDIEYERALKYAPNESEIPFIAWQAFGEFLNRRDAKNKTAKEKAISSNIELLQATINSGKITIPKEIIK